ncbi:MAG: zinc ribbon domain-containing protein [Oleibacter sp.]|nr:zinc ribbon domain-containing protein [Thalassolituus sp.]
MPLYDYKCPDHGVFQELATMADHDKPSFCPQCKTMSARVILIPPAVAQMIKEKREAMERNEKAQHAPEFMTSSQFHEREREKEERHQHDNRNKCGCSNAPKRKSNLLYTAEGNKMFPSMRPWMISH